VLGIDESGEFFRGGEGLNFAPGGLRLAIDTIERDVQRSMGSTRRVIPDSSLGRSKRHGARS
jgi:hypothetical protein